MQQEASLLPRDDQPVDTTPPGVPYDEVVEHTHQSLDRLESLFTQLTTDVATHPEGESSDYTQTALQPPEFNYALPPEFFLSVVVPVYNEQATICRVIGSILALPLPLEVIAVDDGSTDGTGELLEKLEAQLPHLHVIYQGHNLGKGSALRRGFAAAQGSIVVIQDADLEYDPRDIPSLVEPVAKNEADVVYGSRFLQPRRSGTSVVHRLGNWLLTSASNVVTGWQLTDMETGFKAFRHELLDQISLEQDGFGVEVELTAKLAAQNVRILERPISYVARGWKDGKKIGWRDAVHALYCIVRYRRGKHPT